MCHTPNTWGRGGTRRPPGPPSPATRSPGDSECWRYKFEINIKIKPKLTAVKSFQFWFMMIKILLKEKKNNSNFLLFSIYFLQFSYNISTMNFIWTDLTLTSVHNSATFPMLLLKSSKKVVILNEISSK